MTVTLQAVTFDAHDPARLAQFWAALTGQQLDGLDVVPADDTQIWLRFAPSAEQKDRPNPGHLHLTSDAPDAQQATVARALELGATHLDVGQKPEEKHIVLADPEGNEFCVIEYGNKFLANTGFVGELTCEGTRAVGYFWSQALDWPLNWDQDEETSINSPAGGTKISWGGPPIAPKAPKNRLHLDLATPPGGDLDAEVERLVALGATRIDIGQGDVDWVVLADPDGNEFCVLPPS